MRDFHALQARAARSIKPNQTKSNLLGVGDGGSDSGQWLAASGWWRKRPSEYRPVKPSQTQSNRIKPNQTCRSVESDEKGRWNTGWSNLVKPSQTSWGQLACPEIGQSDGERTRRKAPFATLRNQTGDTLWLTNVQMTANGNQYAVTVTNPFTIYSNSATLSVQARAVNVSLTGYGAIVAADQPVAFWRLNEASNALTATDAVGSFDGTYDTTNGTIVWGIPTGIPNDTNTGVDLQDPQTTNTGLGGTVQIPYALELNPFGPWSVEAWVRPDSVDGQYRVPISSMFNTNYDSNPSGWNIFENTSIPTFWDMVLYTAGTYWYTGTDSAYPISTPGTWNHLVITDDGTNILLYVNAQVGNATTVAASGIHAARTQWRRERGGHERSIRPAQRRGVFWRERRHGGRGLLQLRPHAGPDSVALSEQTVSDSFASQWANHADVASGKSAWLDQYRRALAAG